MNNIFSTLLSSIRAKFTTLWTKAKLFISPTYWRTKGITKLRGFFTKLFNVKPKNKYDYYAISKWLVSKRLAYALVIGLGVLCSYFIMVMQPVYGVAGSNGQTGIRSYYYHSIPLKFKTGVVKILAKDKHVAYVGNVDKGYCVGTGKLYDKQNALVYEGQFDKSMFNGKGKLFYPSGTLRYEGMFVDNEYNGQGISYQQSGVVEYEGNFLNDEKSGPGKLYNSAGSAILNGNFVDGRFAFAELLGKTTAEVSQMYIGLQRVYSAGSEYCVEMAEINGVYGIDSGENALEGNAVVNQVYINEDTIALGGNEMRTINDLTAYFGEPSYYGQTWITLPEAVLFNSRKMTAANTIGHVAMDIMEVFDDVYTVNRYDHNFETYIYVYERDGLLYTFYVANGGESGFQCYSISQSP